MRLFVALELPDAWREAAVEVRAALEVEVEPRDPEAASALRWVRPELLHLTLRFLGEFPDGEVPRLQEALDRHVEAFELTLTLEAAGRFGAPHRTQVVWLGVGGDLDGLRALAGRVEAAVVAAGAPPDAHALQPHITLARVRERASAEQRRAIAAAVDGLSHPTPRILVTREVSLVRSTLGREGPRYEVKSRHGG